MAGARDLADRLAQLTKIPSRIASEVAAGITAELRSEFESASNAYGNAWKPLLPTTVQRKRGDSRILRRTDAMSSEIEARPTSGSGVEISVAEYGQFHQAGTKHMVARKILPDGSALPKSWQEIIESAKASAFAKAMGR
jgi:hypothetical protein